MVENVDKIILFGGVKRVCPPIKGGCPGNLRVSVYQDPKSMVRNARHSLGSGMRVVTFEEQISCGPTSETTSKCSHLAPVLNEYLVCVGWM